MQNTTRTPSEAEASRRPRGRPRTTTDETKRDAIIAEARRTFHELGYAGTTMDLVATRCRISKQTLYRLFSSKTALFRAMIAVHRASMVALPRAEGETLPLAETLEQIFRIDIDEEADQDRKAFIHFIVGEAERYPEIACLLQKDGVEQSRLLLADWLRLQCDRGRIDITDAESCARMLLSMVLGALAPIPGDIDQWPSRLARDAHLRGCFDVFLNGVASRQPR